jgi:CheY-like chemotaxis protein
MTSPLVLVADDCRTLQVITRRYLEAIGCECVVTASGEDAYKQANLMKFDLLIFDLRMPDEDGQSLLSRIRRPDQRNATTPHLYISSEDPIALMNRGITEGEVIRKPIEESLFCDRVTNALTSSVEGLRC